MRTVVVVDDEPIIRLDICDMLENSGFEVVYKASDGFDAVEACARLGPDLVLMDIKMPMFDGLGAARKIIDGALAGCVVIITAFYDEELIEAAKDIGVAAYLVKPIEEKNLIPAIEIALCQSGRLLAGKRAAEDAENKLLEKNLIDRAKMLMAQKDKTTEGEAYARLRKFAMDRRLTLAEAANAVVEMNGDKTLTGAKELLMKKYGISEEAAYKRLKRRSDDGKTDILQAAREIIRELS